MNIFESGKTISVEWFYFKAIGDQIQGTYIGKLVGLKDSFQNDQIVYEILTKTGIKRVGFRVSQKINKNMDYINFGQIVGFKYVGKGKFRNKITGKDMEYKDIQVFADPKIVDQEWIDSQKMGRVEVVPKNVEGSNYVEQSEGEDGEEVSVPVIEADNVKGWGDFETAIPTETPATAPVVKATKKTVEEKLVEIAELAKTKLSVIDPSKVKEAVMEATELAFISSNYDKIITALKALA